MHAALLLAAVGDCRYPWRKGAANTANAAGVWIVLNRRLNGRTPEPTWLRIAIPSGTDATVFCLEIGLGKNMGPLIDANKFTPKAQPYVFSYLDWASVLAAPP
jgi:hypothetical protein